MLSEVAPREIYKEDVMDLLISIGWFLTLFITIPVLVLFIILHFTFKEARRRGREKGRK